MAYNKQIAQEVFNNLVDSVKADKENLTYMRALQTCYERTLIDQLNLFREMANEIAQNLKDAEFKKVFSDSSECIRRVVGSLEAIRVKTEAAEQNCNGWLKNYRQEN